MLKQQPKKILKTWTETEPAVKIAVYSVLGESKTPVNSLANNKKMLKAASDLIGDEVYVWHSKINFKKPGAELWSIFIRIEFIGKIEDIPLIKC